MLRAEHVVAVVAVVLELLWGVVACVKVEIMVLISTNIRVLLRILRSTTSVNVIEA